MPISAPIDSRLEATVEPRLPFQPAPDTRSAVPEPIASWRPLSVALIVMVWLVLHVGGLFSPGLLDDVDSVYIEIAREMTQRHDFITPFVDGVRFFDKPPLLYWVAAGSMHLFGVHDWAARLPLALLTLALFLSTYFLGLRLLARHSPATAPDRAALYAALALATSIGPYLYTRFFIPDIVVTLWLTLSIHLFLAALSRAELSAVAVGPPQHTAVFSTGALRNKANRALPSFSRTAGRPSSLAPMLGFGATLALSALTKGLIGIVFPIGFVALYLAVTRRLSLLRRLHPVATLATTLLLALPWHIAIARRNPAIPLPSGLGLPARGGWAWFYLYNEHVARFLSRRIPHDYGQVPIPLFWLLAGIWLLPWTTFLLPALRARLRSLRHLSTLPPQERETSLTLLLWPTLVLGFFTLSARQEYYSLPALPAFALLIGGLLARADTSPLASAAEHCEISSAAATVRRWTLIFLLPFSILLAAVTIAFAAVAHPAAHGTDIATLLAHSEDSYNLSLSHLFDLTPAAMSLFCGPLLLVALAALTLGPGAFLIRRRGHTFAANLTMAAGATALLLAVHAGLVGFYPTLGSKQLAGSIVATQQIAPVPAATSDRILIDGELTAGSTLLFYTRQPVLLVNGRINGPWYGSFWPDAPHIFEDETSLRELWRSPHRVFLLTYHPADRTRDLSPFAPVHTLSAAGGKAILTNRP